MKVEGPQTYELAITPNSLVVTCEKGTSRFSGLATSKLPKLYIVSAKGKPVYVGFTKQSVGNRLRMKADGRNGYHGYKWRRTHKKATLSVWCHSDAEDGNVTDIETVEAEIVFLIRQHLGQWPESQTEIHFHPSLTKHRKVAQQIFEHFRV